MNNIVAKVVLIMILMMSGTSAFAAILTPEKLSSEIEKQVVGKLSKNLNGEVQAKALLLPVDNFQIPDGELDVVVELDNSDFCYKKYAQITLKVNGKKVKKFPTPIALTLYQKVWVATDNISRDKSLTPDNFTVEKKNVTNNYALVIPASKDISDYVAIRDIRVGDIIDRRYVMPRPDVAKNSVVSVIFDTGGVNVAIDAEATQNGCIGDLIRVHSNAYKKFYTGRIVSANKVIVKI